MHHRWSGRCVCIHGRLTSRFSGQANTPPPSGGFFHSFSCLLSLWKNVFLQHLLLKFLDTGFRREERPLLLRLVAESRLTIFHIKQTADFFAQFRRLTTIMTTFSHVSTGAPPSLRPKGAQAGHQKELLVVPVWVEKLAPQAPCRCGVSGGLR